MEINPQTINPEYALPTFTPCGPWITSYDEFNPRQVVWNQISFAPDPYQQLFNFQDNRVGPGLQRRTYTLDPNKSYNLTIQQSDEYAYFTYGGFYDDVTGVYVPIQYVGTTLSGVLGSDLGAIAWFDYARDYPAGLYYSYSNKYQQRIKRDVPPGTEITMVVFDGQKTINYHTRIETPTFTIESITGEDTLLHYYSRNIDFRLNFQQSSGSCQLDGYGGAYPLGIKFNVDIVQGQEYGNLYYPGTVADPEQSGTMLTDLEDEYGIGITNYTIKYKADGVQPDSLNPGIVTIRCSSNDLDIAPVEVSFTVKYNTDPPEEGGIILVNFNKESFSPGDTATTNCKWLTSYNELLDFPAEQSFNVEITGGSEFGMLLDPNTGTIADNLQGVSNGFKVITATSIPYDSVVIRLKVNTSLEVNNSSRMITNQNPKSELRENNITDIVDGSQTITPDLLIIGGEEIIGFGDVVVIKDCEDAKTCNGYTTIPPQITTEELPKLLNEENSKYVKINPCDLMSAAGHFTLPQQEFISQSVVLDACYDRDQRTWQFYLDNPIRIVTLWGYCYRPEEYSFIESINEIPSNYLCPDPIFGTQSKFITALWGKFLGMDIPLFIPKILVHEEEMIHFQQVTTILNSIYFQEEFQRLFAEKIQYQCKDFTSIEEVNQKIKNEVISDFILILSQYVGKNRQNIENEMRTLLEPLYVEWETSAYTEMKIRNCK